MMRTKAVALALGVGVAALVGAGAFGALAYGHGHGHGHGRHALAEKMIRWHVDEELAALGATDAQKQQVRQIEDRLLAQVGATHRSGGSLHAQILSAFETDTPDRDRIHQLVDTHVDDMRKVAHDVADGVLDAYRILTPEQRQKLVAHAREHTGQKHQA